ncbi:hypothetical protein INR49_016966 [Caranx melampygus]|nr:hypothetical protein INR49_016966 [Caranx melampygus]
MCRGSSGPLGAKKTPGQGENMVPGHSEVRTSAAATLLEHRLYCSPRPQDRTLLSYSRSLLEKQKGAKLTWPGQAGAPGLQAARVMTGPVMRTVILYPTEQALSTLDKMVAPQ